MSQLKLRLDSELEGEEISSGAIVNLYPIEGSSPNRRRHPAFAIPTGSGSSFYTLDAEPGRYLIEAKLPSGDVISKEVTIEPGGPPLEVRLRCDRSPREWLAWQQFSGKIAKQSLYERNPSATIEVVGNRPPPSAEAASRYGLPQLVRAAFSEDHPPDDQSWQWAALADACRGQQTSFPWLIHKSPLPARNSDDQVQSFVLSASSLGLPPQPPMRGTPFLPGGRQLLAMHCGPELEFISLPLPWVTFDTWRECPLDIVVRTTIENPQSPRTSLTIRDPSIGAAMSYMTAGSGSLNRARVIFDQAKDMLFHKSDNPFAAAAGAYALITKQEASEQEDWHSWVRNLMNWYPWLPDGAIQLGRIKIRDEASDNDIDEARGVLFSAYRRGLPFFSIGIRWLLNGLTIFADDGDEDARKMAGNVHRVALRTDMSQPFTVVRIGPRSS